jgi:hypothetical protein
MRRKTTRTVSLSTNVILSSNSTFSIFDHFTVSKAFQSQQKGGLYSIRVMLIVHILIINI